MLRIAIFLSSSIALCPVLTHAQAPPEPPPGVDPTVTLEVRARGPAQTLRVLPEASHSVLWVRETPPPLAVCTTPCTLALAPGGYTLMGPTGDARWRALGAVHLGSSGARVELSDPAGTRNRVGASLQVVAFMIAGLALLSAAVVSVMSMECEMPPARCGTLHDTMTVTAVMAFSAAPLMGLGVWMRSTERQSMRVYGAVAPWSGGGGATAAVGVRF